MQCEAATSFGRDWNTERLNGRADRSLTTGQQQASEALSLRPGTTFRSTGESTHPPVWSALTWKTLECYSALPRITKREVIDSRAQFVNKSLGRKHFWTTTGGSTGETVMLCHDAASLARIKAREMNFLAQIGFGTGQRVAVLLGITD